MKKEKDYFYIFESEDRPGWYIADPNLVREKLLESQIVVKAYNRKNNPCYFILTNDKMLALQFSNRISALGTSLNLTFDYKLIKAYPPVPEIIVD